MFHKNSRTCHLPLDSEIIEMYLNGMSSKDIAVKLGTSVSSIAKRIQKAGVSRNLSEAKKLAFTTGKHGKSHYWLGKKQSPETVEKRMNKIRGDRHWNWKGGKEARQYRRVVKKEGCEFCKSENKLCIHHKDLDHYNNNPSNLQVLCKSCHISLHRKLYWASIRKGEEPPKSNAPIGWNK